MTEEEAPEAAATVRALEALAAELAARDPRSPSEREALAELERRLEALIEILIARGALGAGHRKILSKIRAGASRIKLSMVEEKLRVASSEIDCASMFLMTGFDKVVVGEFRCQSRLYLAVYFAPGREREPERAHERPDAASADAELLHVLERRPDLEDAPRWVLGDDRPDPIRQLADAREPRRRWVRGTRPSLARRRTFPTASRSAPTRARSTPRGSSRTSSAPGASITPMRRSGGQPETPSRSGSELAAA